MGWGAQESHSGSKSQEEMACSWIVKYILSCLSVSQTPLQNRAIARGMTKQTEYGTWTKCFRGVFQTLGLMKTLRWGKLTEKLSFCLSSIRHTVLFPLSSVSSRYQNMSQSALITLSCCQNHGILVCYSGLPKVTIFMHSVIQILHSIKSPSADPYCKWKLLKSVWSFWHVGLTVTHDAIACTDET